MPSEAKAQATLGVARNARRWNIARYADVGRVFGMVKVRYADVSYGTRLERSEDRTLVHRRLFICQVALSGNSLDCANDSGPNAQEPDDGNLSSPVLKQRRGQRWLRRL